MQAWVGLKSQWVPGLGRSLPGHQTQVVILLARGKAKANESLSPSLAASSLPNWSHLGLRPGWEKPSSTYWREMRANEATVTLTGNWSGTWLPVPFHNL